MNKTIITAAVCGSGPTKEMNPAVPYSPEEIAEAALECRRAGAAIAHIHVRNPLTGKPDFRLELFAEVLERIRRDSDMIVNLTTSGLNLNGSNAVENRLAPATLRPDICSFDVGSINFQDRVFLNPPEWGETAPEQMRRLGVKPEIEVFDAGHIYQALHYIQKGIFRPPPYFQLCMGTRWGMAATPENLLFMKDKLPENAVWSVLGIGRDQLPMITMGLLLGGNIRVGFEDNIYIRKGALAESNARMVEMAVRLTHDLQREVASADEARQMLGIVPVMS